MRHNLGYACIALLAAALLTSACGSKPGSQLACEPACPSGTHCTQDGCIPDSPPASPDASVADLAGGCDPPCAGATPYCNSNLHCVPCLTDDHCPGGQLCRTVSQVSLCVPGCTDDARCAGLGASMRCCGGRCVDTATDPENCGACTMACLSSHAAAACAGGGCTGGACRSGWADCNQDPADGCETNVSVDSKSCGACGKGCSAPNALSGCSNGCYVAACKFGWDDCNADPLDGCEVSVLSDSRNCGGCGRSCAAPPHAMVACRNAACQLTQCVNGFADCDGQAGNGCEVSIATDFNNCGRCGNSCVQGQVCIAGQCTCPPCNFPNAKSACVNNMCALGECNANFGDCNFDPKDGCERPLAADVSNCGACGNVCAQGLVCINGACTCPNCNLANARTRCINNVCVLDSCLPGFGDCDNNPQNGCESDFSKDNASCSKCGMACAGQTPVCQAGVCVGGVMWVFGDYNGPGTKWDPNKEWDGAVDCAGTCAFVNMQPVGVRFICNLHGVQQTEGCNQMNDGDYGLGPNCDIWYDMGVKKGNNEDCAGGQLMTCIKGACKEQVTYHAMQCQCTP